MTMPPPLKIQHVSYSPIPNVHAWHEAEEVPTGSREKLTLVEPDTGKHYIFKYPKQHREHQLWSELIASFIAGDLLGWKVQHTGIAKLNGRYGNILAYVFEPPWENTTQEVFIEGWTLCKQATPDFDVEKGTNHTLPLLWQVRDEVLVCQYNLERKAFMDFWAQAIAFDSLISNTDRHAENWAIIKRGTESRMAPLYDNGSSLGCGIDSIGLNRAFDECGRIKSAHLDAQFRNGRHHLRVDSPQPKGSGFSEVCAAFLEFHPEGRKWFEQAEAVDLEQILSLMDSIRMETDMEAPYSLSERRQRHIHAMLQVGLKRIRSILK